MPTKANACAPPPGTRLVSALALAHVSPIAPRETSGKSQRKPRCALAFRLACLGFPWLFGLKKANKSQAKARKAKGRAGPLRSCRAECPEIPVWSRQWRRRPRTFRAFGAVKCPEMPGKTRESPARRGAPRAQTKAAASRRPPLCRSSRRRRCAYCAIWAFLPPSNFQKT